MTSQTKLQEVVDTLRRIGWSFTQFIAAWSGDRLGSEHVQLEHRQYRTVKQRRAALSRAVRDFGCDKARPAKELDRLIKEPFFNKFDHKMDFEDMDFSAVDGIIRRVAPSWYRVLWDVMTNARYTWQSYNGNSQSHDATLKRRMFAITSMVCHSRAKQNSNFLSAMVATYLVGSGVKRRVIECLNGLGFCLGYMQTTRMMGDVARCQARSV